MWLPWPTRPTSSWAARASTSCAPKGRTASGGSFWTTAASSSTCSPRKPTISMTWSTCGRTASRCRSPRGAAGGTGSRGAGSTTVTLRGRPGGARKHAGGLPRCVPITAAGGRNTARPAQTVSNLRGVPASGRDQTVKYDLQSSRGQMAEGLGGRAYLPRRDRPHQAQVLRAGGVPVSFRRRPARGPSAQLHRAGHRGPAKSGSAATTCCIPWAGTPSACPPRTTP